MKLTNKINNILTKIFQIKFKSNFSFFHIYVFILLIHNLNKYNHHINIQIHKKTKYILYFKIISFNNSFLEVHQTNISLNKYILLNLILTNIIKNITNHFNIIKKVFHHLFHL